MLKSKEEKVFDLTKATNKNLLIKKDEKYYDPILDNIRKIDLINAHPNRKIKVPVYYNTEYTDNITNELILYRKKGVFDGIDYIIEPNLTYERSVPFKDINSIVLSLDVNIYFNFDNLFDANIDKKFLPHLNLLFNVNIPQNLSLPYTLASDVKDKIIFFERIKKLNEDTLEYEFEEIPFSEDWETSRRNFEILVQDFIFNLFDADNFSKFIVIGQNKISLF